MLQDTLKDTAASVTDTTAQLHHFNATPWLLVAAAVVVIGLAAFAWYGSRRSNQTTDSDYGGKNRRV